jgi:hypothetical protein
MSALFFFLGFFFVQLTANNDNAKGNATIRTNSCNVQIHLIVQFGLFFEKKKKKKRKKKKKFENFLRRKAEVD